MKICISSTGKDLSSQIDPRFGRCAYFMIIQTDDMGMEVFENEFKSLGGGAGIQAAGFVHSKGATAVLTGNCGPNAMKVFSENSINAFTGQAGAIKDVVERFKKGELVASVDPTVGDKAGLSDVAGNNCPQGQTGGSCGRGRGIAGGGRGMGGGGRGRGIAGGGRGMGGGGGGGMGGRQS
jgi:predicted Fe-Mo cluster-binding NifX family protein